MGEVIVSSMIAKKKIFNYIVHIIDVIKLNFPRDTIILTITCFIFIFIICIKQQIINMKWCFKNVIKIFLLIKKKTYGWEWSKIKWWIFSTKKKNFVYLQNTWYFFGILSLWVIQQTNKKIQVQHSTSVNLSNSSNNT